MHSAGADSSRCKAKLPRFFSSYLIPFQKNSSAQILPRTRGHVERINKKITNPGNYFVHQLGMRCYEIDSPGLIIFCRTNEPKAVGFNLGIKRTLCSCNKTAHFLTCHLQGLFPLCKCSFADTAFTAQGFPMLIIIFRRESKISQLRIFFWNNLPQQL